MINRVPRRTMALFRLGVVLTLCFPGRILGQGFHRDCHDEQQRKLSVQLTQMTEDERSRHAELAAELSRSKQTIKEGEELNKKLDDAAAAANQASLARLQRDQDFRREQRNLAEQARTLDVSNPDAVRRYQKESREFEQKFTNRLTRENISDPRVDRANAAANIFQVEADSREKEFLRKRLAAGVSQPEREKMRAEAFKSVAIDLHLSADQQVTLANNKAWSQAMAAWAMGNSIAKTGNLDSKLEFVTDVGMGKSPWDTAGNTFGEIAGRGLVGNMELTHLSKWGGSADAVDVRGSMGPQTRVAVSQGAAGALRHLDQVSQFKKIFKTDIPPPDPPSKSSSGTEPDPKYGEFVEKFAKAVEKAKDVIWGGYEVEPEK